MVERREVTDIEFVLERDLDCVAGESDGADRGDFWVHAGDAGDHEVGCCQVEARRADEGGDCGCGVDFAFSCDDLTNVAIGGAVDVREEW